MVRQDSPWSTLPTDLLVRIYTYLETVDRARASQSCRHWRAGFQESSLWRTVKFDLKCGHRQLTSRYHQRLRSFLTTVGQHVQHLYINCPEQVEDTAICVARCVHTLLSGLTSLPAGSTTLRSLHLSNLYYEKRWHAFDSSGSSIISTLADFLRSQQSLKTLTMRQARIMSGTGNLLMESFSRSQSTRCLQVLDLTYFYNDYLWSRSNRHLLRTALSQCLNLQQIWLNYFCLALINVEKLCQALKRSPLKYLVCVCQEIDTYVSVIDAESWKRASILCPRLKVSLHLRGPDVDGTMFVVAGMPLFQITQYIQNDRTVSGGFGRRVSLLLDHLSYCCPRSLKYAIFRVESSEPRIAPPLIETVVHFLVACQGLQRLSFNSKLMDWPLAARIRAVASQRTDRRLGAISIL